MCRFSSGGFGKLLADCAALIRSWWDVDRIRISPTEGKLLRLRIGSVIVVNRRSFEVVGHRADQLGSEVTITCDCRGVDGDSRLVIVTNETAVCRLSWIDEHGELELDPLDVEIYG